MGVGEGALRVLLLGAKEDDLSVHSPPLVFLSEGTALWGGRPCPGVGGQGLAPSGGCWTSGAAPLSKEIKGGCGAPQWDSPQPYVSFQM